MNQKSWDGGYTVNNDYESENKSEKIEEFNKMDRIMINPILIDTLNIYLSVYSCSAIK